jgi:hypothetical protein
MQSNLGRIALAATIVLGTGFTVGSAMAQGRQAIMEHCREDLAKFCSSVQPGGGRMKPCIKQNFRSFSPGCQAVLRDMVAEKKQQSQ